MRQLRFLPRDVFLVDTKPKAVDEILGKEEANKKTITEGLVTLVIGVIPEAAEITKPGRLEYSLNGRGFTYMTLRMKSINMLLLAGGRFCSLSSCAGTFAQAGFEVFSYGGN